MLEKCRECLKNKDLVGLSLETKLCEKCRTCAHCEYDRVIKSGTVFYAMSENYRETRILCSFHLGKGWRDRISHRHELSKLIEEYQGEKSSFLGLQQENKELKVRVSELENEVSAKQARIEELGKELVELQSEKFIAQIETNPHQK